MRLLRLLFLTAGLMLTTFTYAGHSDHMSYIADGLRRNGAPLSYWCDTYMRSWIIWHEKAVGYEKCCRDYYEVLCRVAEESAQQNDTLMYDLGMSRDFMAWQNGKISTDIALSNMQRMMEECRRRFGELSVQYSTTSCIMAEFYCATGKFEGVDSCCNRIINWESLGMTVYRWHYSVALHSKMVSEVGRGMIKKAWSTADWIVKSYNQSTKKNVSISNLDDKTIDLSSEEKNTASRLAKQMALQLFPPTSAEYQKNEIEPWPLIIPYNMMAPEIWGLLSVLDLYELLHNLRISEDICIRAYNSYKALLSGIFSENTIFRLANNAGIPSLAINLYRRLAMVETKHNEWFNTQNNHQWSKCVCIERLKDGKSSAVSLLRFAAVWIEKRPFNMLTFVEEAALAMQQDLSPKTLTQQQLMLIRYDREWLVEELPKLIALVANIPEYAPSIEVFKALANKIQR